MSRSVIETVVFCGLDECEYEVRPKVTHLEGCMVPKGKHRFSHLYRFLFTKKDLERDYDIILLKESQEIVPLRRIPIFITYPSFAEKKYAGQEMP